MEAPDDAAAPTAPEEHPVRAAAFRILFETGRPVPPAVLAAQLGRDLAEIEAETAALERAGLVRRDEQGRIVGSVGLSIVPGSSEVSVAGRTFWVWCAKTALGVLGTLGRGGQI